jgi:hypothetical protein
MPQVQARPTRRNPVSGDANWPARDRVAASAVPPSMATCRVLVTTVSSLGTAAVSPSRNEAKEIG